MFIDDPNWKEMTRERFKDSCDKIAERFYNGCHTIN